jgi:hypothetical protein
VTAARSAGKKMLCVRRDSGTTMHVTGEKRGRSRRGLRRRGLRGRRRWRGGGSRPATARAQGRRGAGRVRVRKGKERVRQGSITSL